MYVIETSDSVTFLIMIYWEFYRWERVSKIATNFTIYEQLNSSLCGANPRLSVRYQCVLRDEGI